MYSLGWPSFGHEEAQAVNRVISSKQLFADKEVSSFENAYSSYVKCKYALGVGNATQGLHLALAALSIGLGDEVVVPPYSWISTASCVLMQNAVPIFCDVETDSFSLDPDKLLKAITPRTKAVILVHVFGYPSIHTSRIKEICRDNNVFLIEDNSHAHGAQVMGSFTGTIGDIGVASLHQRKSISVGDGGIVTTNQSDIYQKIYKLRSFGDHELSYNYRMTEFAGALGKVALQNLSCQNKIRQQRANLVAQRLSSLKGIRVLLPNPQHVSVFYAVLIVLEDIREIPDLDSLVGHLPKHDAPLRYTWSPLHHHPHFQDHNGNEPARGFPWRSEKYKNLGGKWSIPKLPVSEKYLPNKIIEFYVHPTLASNDFESLLSQLYILLASCV